MMLYVAYYTMVIAFFQKTIIYGLKEIITFNEYCFEGRRFVYPHIIQKKWSLGALQ